MAYGVVHFFPGGCRRSTTHRSRRCILLAAGRRGSIFHAAGPSEGGRTIMAVHDSQASWEQFRDEVLMPRMQAGIDGGFEAPHQETAIDLVTVQR